MPFLQSQHTPVAQCTHCSMSAQLFGTFSTGEPRGCVVPETETSHGSCDNGIAHFSVVAPSHGGLEG